MQSKLCGLACLALMASLYARAGEADGTLDIYWNDVEGGGATLIVTPADEFIANLDEHCQGNYIKLSVDPSGKSCTVSIPATGHHRTFATRQNKPNR